MVSPGKNGTAYKGHGAGGRPYGVMLLLAIGAAILGVMVLHKLREGRLFSLLVKERDHELISLHLLLQREQEFSKEVRAKLEEMKSNMYSVKAQKSDVDGRLLEVESLVSSLKDEQKILESQLEEKRNEIKMLRQQQMMMPSEGIRETSNQKEGEIEDPKSHSEEPASVWSVSGDNPLNPPMNITDAVKLDQSGGIGLSQGSSNYTHVVDGKPKQSEDVDTVMTGSSDIRAKTNKQRKLRRRRWRDLIKKVREDRDNSGASGKTGQNEDVEFNMKHDSSPQRVISISNQDSENMGNKGQDEHATSRKEEFLSIAENVTYTSLDVTAEIMKHPDSEPDSDSRDTKSLSSEPDLDSSAGKVLDSEPDLYSSAGIVVDSEPDPESSSGKVDVDSSSEEAIMSNKDDELEHEKD